VPATPRGLLRPPRIHPAEALPGLAPPDWRVMGRQAAALECLWTTKTHAG